MGFVYKVNGIIKIRYELPRGIDGKRRTRTESCKGLSEPKARKLLAARETDVARGTFIDASSLTVSQYLRQWLANATHRLAEQTVKRYREIITLHVDPFIGTVEISKLSPSHLQALYTTLLGDHGRADGNGPLSAQTVKSVHAMLHAAFRQAVKLQVIARNPADIVEAPSVPRPHIEIASPSDWKKLLAALDGSPFRIPILLIMATGLRRGEALGLQWRDLDWTTGRLSVRRSLTQIPGKVFAKSTKTDRARLVLLPGSVVEVLREHREKQKECAVVDVAGWICTMPDGALIVPSQLSRGYASIQAATGVRTTLHGLRHTQATELLRAGVPLKVVSERLGHANVQTTIMQYQHVLPEMQDMAVEVVEKMLSDG